MVEMQVVGVRVELPSNSPMVLLRETDGERRLLPIFIGGPEATAIAFLSDGTFYAELRLSVSGKEHQVSSRPSDAIALAVRTGTTLYAEEAVLDEAAVPLEDEEEQEEVVEKFREFIDNVNPEDFAS